MNVDYTDVTVVLDRSGSMSSVKDDTIGGFNNFLREQKALPGKATLTLAQFDDKYEIVHDGKNINDVPELNNNTFVPRGMTALLDAIGRTIVATGERLKNMKESDRPGKVIFVVLTDGEENSSHEYTKEKVSEMIKHQTDVYKWAFIFLGADQDAIKSGSNLNFAFGNCLSVAHNSVGHTNAYASLSKSIRGLRNATMDQYEMHYCCAIDDDAREAQKKAGAKS